MAKPIKETPFLSGKDAKRFVQENNNVERITEKERKEIAESYKTLSDILE